MKHILVVDDNKTNLALAKSELAKDYKVTLVISGLQALQFLETCIPDLILLDICMPDLDGHETMKRIRANEHWANIPIIFLTMDTTPETEAQCLSDGADDFIAKPFVPQVMKSRVARVLELYDLRNDLESRLAEKTNEVELVTLNSIMAIANALEAKDTYTRGHSNRVARCSVAIATRLGLSDEAIKNIHLIALLHDIGKIGIPDAVLNKPAALNDEEYSTIKQHPTIGYEILKDIRVIPDVHLGTRYHHERYDGTGYPHGLKGEEIPLIARIIAIADTYDAMTSNRAYRHALSNDTVIAEFEKNSGTQFDPTLASLFIDMLKDGSLSVLMNEEPNTSKIELHETTSNEQQFQIAELIHDAVKRSITKYEDKEMDLIIRLDPELPNTLIGDNIQLRQIMTSLLADSVQHTKNGGIVLQISQNNHDTSIDLIVSMKDTGVELTEENVHKFNSRFQLTDATLSRSDESHVFTFTIPLKIADAAPCIQLKRTEPVTIAFLLDWSKYKHPLIIKEFRKMILELGKKLNVSFSIFDSIDKLTTTLKEKPFTHCLTTKDKYIRHATFFQSIMNQYEIIVIQDCVQPVKLPAIIKQMQAPFYALSFATVLNQAPAVLHAKEPERCTDKDCINFKTGMMYCGNTPEIYYEILNVYLNGAPAYQTSLATAYEQADWERYIIDVHALKSSSLSIGAVHFSELAKKLEFAGKEENYDIIHANHATLLEQYEAVLSEATAYLQAHNALQKPVQVLEMVLEDISVETFTWEVQHLITACKEFDNDTASTIAEKLIRCKIKDWELTTHFETISQLIDDYDYEQAITSCQQLLQMI